MESKRLEAVAKRMSDLAIENGSFNVQDGVQLVVEKNAQGNDGLRIVFEDGYDDKYASSKTLTEVLEKMENPDEAFWMIHPERESVILVENDNKEHSFEMTGSFFVNPSAIQDCEVELAEFLDFLEKENRVSSGFFRILEENGDESDEYGITLSHAMNDLPDTPANVFEPYHCEADWLTFWNSDPYNSGYRNVCEEIQKFVGGIGVDELDEETIKRINNFYLGDIRNFEPEPSNEPEYDDDYDR